MRSEQQQLHDAYDKHERGQRLYRAPKDPYSNWPALTQCPCGDWLVYNASDKAWEPLFGHVAAGFINQNPELYPILKAWWPHRPCKGEPAVTWDGIDFNVDPGIKAFYDPAAKVVAKPSGHQNDSMEAANLGQYLHNIMPAVPKEYTQDDYGLYKSVTISTTDNTAGQILPGASGTPVAPRMSITSGAVLKDKP